MKRAGIFLPIFCFYRLRIGPCPYSGVLGTQWPSCRPKGPVPVCRWSCKLLFSNCPLHSEIALLFCRAAPFRSTLLFTFSPYPSAVRRRSYVRNWNWTDHRPEPANHCSSATETSRRHIQTYYPYHFGSKSGTEQ